MADEPLVTFDKSFDVGKVQANGGAGVALVESGLSRDDAYRIVQAAARRAVEERRNFREVLEADEAVGLDEASLSRAFDTERMLAHRYRFLDALTWAP